MTGNGGKVPVGKWLVYADRWEVIGFCEWYINCLHLRMFGIFIYNKMAIYAR